MTRQFRWVLAAALAWAATVQATSAVLLAAHSHERHAYAGAQKHKSSTDRHSGDRSEHSRLKWWEDDRWRAEVGITDQQSARIRNIFEQEIVKLRAVRVQLKKLEAELSERMSEPRPDLAVLTERWDRVGNLLSEMYKTRQMMLYRINKELTAEQRARLQAMSERIHDERRQKGESRQH